MLRHKIFNCLKNVLNNKKGETLIESVVSIFLFTVMILGISVITVAAIKITQISNTTSIAIQVAVNEIAAQTVVNTIDGPSVSTENVTFTSTDSADINATQEVQYVNHTSIIGFYPEVT